MKPRLKLHANGDVSVVVASEIGWNHERAKAAVINHYGSMAAFARLFRVDYRHVQDALASDHASTRAGGIARVRQLLGLKSNPTLTSERQVRAQQARRKVQFAISARESGDFFRFEQALLRLKQVLNMKSDKDIACALGMEPSAFNKRKSRGSFPEDDLRTVAAAKPALGIDVAYVLTGDRTTPPHSTPRITGRRP